MNAPRIAFRDVCRGTDKRTMLCCLVPPNSLLVHPAPFLVRHSASASDEAFLLGILSSLPFDWYMRKVVELHMTFEHLTYAPIPWRTSDEAVRRRLADLAGRLSAVDERFSDWAAEVGVPIGSITTPEPKEWDHLKVWIDEEAEIDALVSHLYGLTRDQVEHIFATFHRGWDYRPRLEATLKHFDQIGAQK